MWTLKPAVSFVRRLEKVLRPLGYWTAIGGSVLYNGQSENDLDILICPLDEVAGEKTLMLNLLATHFAIEKAGNSNYPEGREIWKGTLNGKKIDFFIVPKM